MRYKRLLVAIVLLAAGCSKPKPPVTSMPNIGCQESDTRNCVGELQITGNAHTRTPDSPAVTGGRNVFIYEGRYQPESPSSTKRKWIVKADPSPFIKEEDWICLSTGRIDDAQIVLGSSKVWTVYSHGAAYGEFIDKGSALKQAERIATSKHLECD